MGCEAQNKILKGESELKASAGSAHCHQPISRHAKTPNNKNMENKLSVSIRGKFSNRKKIKYSTGISEHLKISFCITDITEKSKKRLIGRSN